MLTPLRKLILAGPSGWLLLFRAQAAVFRARRRIRNTPTGQLFREVDGSGAVPRGEKTQGREGARGSNRSFHGTSPALPPRAVEARALAVERVARLGIGRGLCLVRSLALMELLTRDGLPGGRILVGVRRARGTFEAHAWVEWHGHILGDDPTYVASFLPLTDPDQMTAELPWAAAPTARDYPVPGRRAP
jgi:hypothetical protein